MKFFDVLFLLFFLLQYTKKDFAHLGFVWFDGKTPKACGVQFKIISGVGEKTKIEIQYFRFSIPKDNLIHVRPFGTYEAISHYIYKDALFWENKSLEKTVTQLLEIQSKATPETVGKPFSVVKLAPNNYVKWYTKGICQ